MKMLAHATFWCFLESIVYVYFVNHKNQKHAAFNSLTNYFIRLPIQNTTNY